MKLKETLQKALDNLPRIATIALLTLVLSACDTSPTTNPNTGSGGETELRGIDPNKLNDHLGIPTRQPGQGGFKLGN